VRRGRKYRRESPWKKSKGIQKGGGEKLPQWSGDKRGKKVREDLAMLGQGPGFGDREKRKIENKEGGVLNLL